MTHNATKSCVFDGDRHKRVSSLLESFPTSPRWAVTHVEKKVEQDFLTFLKDEGA